MAYAIISLGGKQYRVREGETLLVDRLRTEEGKTFQPNVLLLGGDGDLELAPSGSPVTARVLEHVLGPKVRIGKYKPKTGYKKHAGYRSRLSRIEVESIGAKRAAAKKEATPKDEAVVSAPAGYEDLKVAEVADWTHGRHLRTLEEALAYERAHAARKGAIAALETAITSRKEKS